MNQGRTIFSQVMDFLPQHRFRRCVDRYRGNYRIRSFTCFDQFMCMAFAQLTYRESLRDIVCCLRAMQEKLYHMGIRGKVSRSTLGDANEIRDWGIYSNFAQVLIYEARRLYANDDFGLELQETVYALDASTIDLCLSVFPWARFRKTKAGIKLDFERLYTMHLCSAFFVTRTKTNTGFRRLYSNKVNKSTGVRCDQIIMLTGFYTKKAYPEKLRRVKFFDAESGKRLSFLTNQFTLPALTIANLYRCWWQVELFFKWIKQHLRIKAFYGTSENAVKTQIWIAISVYVLVAIMKKRMQIDVSLYTILQILSISLFEKKPILQVFTEPGYKNQIATNYIQLNLFDS